MSKNIMNELEQKKILNAIEKAVSASSKDLEAATKWGKLTFAFGRDFHHWICAVSPTEKSVNLIFHFGGLLNDKKKVFIAGESFFMRKLEYRNLEEVNPVIIKDFVRQAIGKLEYFKAKWKELNRKAKAKK